MNLLRYAPWVLALLGATALAAGLVAMIWSAIAPARLPEGAFLGGLVLTAVSGAVFGASLLAARLRGLRPQPRALLLFMMAGALLGGFGAFVIMATSAASGIPSTAVVMLLLVLVSLAGVGAGARALAAAPE